jgi:hypothetical protein
MEIPPPRAALSRLALDEMKYPDIRILFIEVILGLPAVTFTAARACAIWSFVLGVEGILRYSSKIKF